MKKREKAQDLQSYLDEREKVNTYVKIVKQQLAFFLYAAENNTVVDLQKFFDNDVKNLFALALHEKAHPSNTDIPHMRWLAWQAKALGDPESARIREITITLIRIFRELHNYKDCVLDKYPGEPDRSDYGTGSAAAQEHKEDLAHFTAWGRISSRKARKILRHVDHLKNLRYPFDLPEQSKHGQFKMAFKE